MPFFCSATRFRAAMHIADQQERGGCEPRVGGHIKVVFLPDCAMLCRVIATWLGKPVSGKISRGFKPAMLATLQGSGCSRAGGQMQ